MKQDAHTDTATDTHTDNTYTYTQYFEDAHKRLDETKYHRGLSMETLNRFNIGYDPRWRLPLQVYLSGDKLTKNGKPRSKETWERIPTTPRLIIPTSPYSYLARDVRADIPKEQKPYEKSKVGKVHIFNAQAMYETERPVFIVEGEIDAMSIVDCGAEACALGSIANAHRLLDMLRERKPKAKALIVALDTDEEGERASEVLKNEIKRLNIPVVKWKGIPRYKDANAYLMAGERGFLVTVINDAYALLDRLSDVEDEERKAYQEKSASGYLQPLCDDIINSMDAPYISTGYDALDKVFDGGLYPGLYTMGAISSLGKTTFLAQMADQIAAGGDAQVLYFTLEMSRFEMMAKSISRHTAYLSNARYGGNEYAKTVRGVMTGRFWYSYSDEQKQLIQDAMDDYGTYARNIFHIEGMGDVGTKQIREAVEKHIKMTGKLPVVFVDYLQILAPADEHMTDKQIVDKNILELKKISRDYKIPVITVSSFNRVNYSTEVNMASFKESGAIEYSSDVLLGLQLEGAGTKDFDATKEKSKMPRQIELLILKNRNGACGSTIRYYYDPRFNLFEERELVTPYLSKAPSVSFVDIAVNGEKPKKKRGRGKDEAAGTDHEEAAEEDYDDFNELVQRGLI